ncbi:MAG: hypothetical protein R3Y64_10285 [Peptostreptococcaceae bacterium]
MVMYEVLIKILIVASLIISVKIFSNDKDTKREFTYKLFFTIALILFNLVNYRVVGSDIIDTNIIKDFITSISNLIYIVHSLGIFIIYIVALHRNNFDSYISVLFISIIPTIVLCLG